MRTQGKNDAPRTRKIESSYAFSASSKADWTICGS